MSFEVVILLKLLCAHLLADFVLQSDKVVVQKRLRRHGWHILHAVLHALLAGLAVCDNLSLWYVPVIIGVSHYATDLWKSHRKDEVRYFVIDQTLHLAVIAVMWLFAAGGCDYMARQCASWQFTPRFWAVLSGLLLIFKPSGIVIGKIVAWKWGNEESSIKKGLADAGKWIGYLERLLIFIFVYNEIYAATGFLLAAKSIFRFGELRDSKDIKTTEYIMIGTFMSFAIAITVGLAVKMF
jgi:hypothetical protein